MYLARCRVEDISTVHVEEWEYWNGENWQAEPLSSENSTTDQTANNSTDERKGNKNDTTNDSNSKVLDSSKLGESQRIFWQIQQGQIFFSSHLECLVFVYCDNFWSCQILARTARRPEGPWSQPTVVCKPEPTSKGGNVYSPAVHGYFGSRSGIEEGAEVVISYTNHPNRVEAVRVVFGMRADGKREDELCEGSAGDGHDAGKDNKH